MVRSGDEPREKWLLMLTLLHTANGAIREPANTHIKKSIPDLIPVCVGERVGFGFFCMWIPLQIWFYIQRQSERRKERASACLCMHVHLCMCELTFTSLQPLITAQLIYFSFFLSPLCAVK